MLLQILGLPRRKNGFLTKLHNIYMYCTYIYIYYKIHDDYMLCDIDNICIYIYLSCNII